MASEKNVKNEEKVESVDNVNVDKVTGEVVGKKVSSIVGVDPYADKRNDSESNDAEFEGDTVIYHTGYNISRHSSRKDPKTGIEYYNYAFGYNIVDGDDMIPQTVFFEPSDTGREAYNTLDKIFKGGNFAELEIVKTTRRRMQGSFTRTTYVYSARVSKVLANGAEITSELNVSRGNENKFNNLINIFKADGVVR